MSTLPPPPATRIQPPPPDPERQPPPPYPANTPLFKGALISVDSSQQKVTVPFQFNPATMRRQLRPNEVGSSEADRSTAVRFTGGAVESIQLEAHLDAIDAMDKSSNSVANHYGIHPLLAALELFLYPSTTQVSQYYQQANTGQIDLVPPLAPQLVFVWGPNRVLPVRLASMAVTEEMYDGNLNPIVATVELEMRVLTYSDVFTDNPSYSMWMSHQQHMETMAGWVQTALHRKNLNQMLGVNVANLQEADPSGG